MTRDEAISQGKAALDQAQSDALGGAFDAGVGSVPAQQMPEDVTPYSQEQMDAAKADAAAQQKSVDDGILAAAKADLQSQISDLGLKLKEKDADALEEAIADKLDSLAKELRDRTVAAPAAPVEQPAQPEAPVEAPIEPGAPESGSLS